MQLDKMGVIVPLVGDFHYNVHRLLTQYPDCAQALSKYRINPGNVGAGQRGIDNFAQMIEVACQYDKPIRIGRSEEHTSELQSRGHLVCRLLLEKKKRASSAR